MSKLRVIGNYVSPYVRKVLVCLEIKGLDYEIDPIVPFLGNDRFAEVSPLRRVPVLFDGDVVLSDSSVICQYLEDKVPSPRLYPADIAQRARARWIEEYADTRMADILIWRIFNEVALKPAIWGEKGDREKVARTVEKEVPEIFGYLEQQSPEQGFMFGALSIADIAVMAFIRNYQFCRFTVDPAKWPKLAALVERVCATPAMQKLMTYEHALVRTPPAQQFEVLRQMGAPVATETFGSNTPRRGVMPI
jgi:glutathione S-transferase